MPEAVVLYGGNWFFNAIFSLYSHIYAIIIEISASPCMYLITNSAVINAHIGYVYNIYDNNTPAYTTNIIILSNYDYVESLRICCLYIKSWHMPYTLSSMKELLMFYTLA